MFLVELLRLPVKLKRSFDAPLVGLVGLVGLIGLVGLVGLIGLIGHSRAQTAAEKLDLGLI